MYQWKNYTKFVYKTIFTLKDNALCRHYFKLNLRDEIKRNKTKRFLFVFTIIKHELLFIFNVTIHNSKLPSLERDDSARKRRFLG